MKKHLIFVLVSFISCAAIACSESSGSDDNGGNGSCSPKCKNGTKVNCDLTKVECQYGCNAEGTDCAKSAANTCTPGCVDGVATKCNGSVKTTVQCYSNQCNAEGTDCLVETSECRERCEGGVKFTCQNGLESRTTCSNKKCNQAGTDCAANENTCTPSCEIKGGRAIATLCDGGVPTTKTCPNGCNATNTDCQIGGGGDCEFATKCVGDVLHTCDEFYGELEYSCTSMGQKCSTVDGIDFCREPCSTSGETKTKCNSNSNGSYTVENVCTKGADGNYYFDGLSAPMTPCNSGEACNSTFTACEPSESCNPDTYQAKCSSGLISIASVCSPSKIVVNTDCSAKGQTCVQTTSKMAMCVDYDMSCTELGSKKYKCGINNEIEQKPISTVYTCKTDTNGGKYYLDGVNEQCGNYGCDTSTGKCVVIDAEEGASCNPSDYDGHCNGSKAIYCSTSKNAVVALECDDPNDPGYVCLTASTSANGKYVDCFSAKEKCTEEGANKETKNTYGKYTFECARASDGNLYWVEIGFTDE